MKGIFVFPNSFMQARLNFVFLVTIGATKKRAQGVPWAPPIRSKIGSIRSKIVEERTKIWAFWGDVFHENTSSKSKFRSKGAELFSAPRNLDR